MIKFDNMLLTCGFRDSQKGLLLILVNPELTSRLRDRCELGAQGIPLGLEPGKKDFQEGMQQVRDTQLRGAFGPSGRLRIEMISEPFR